MSLNLFTDHPASVGETYGEHLAVAGGFGLRMILGGIGILQSVVALYLVATGHYHTIVVSPTTTLP